MAEYDVQNYEFKKAMQQIINDEFKPLLLSNGFTQSKRNRYIREKAGLVQLIIFRVGVDSVRAYASFCPIYYPFDYVLDYGIEITGSNGFMLLDGKYFTTVFEPEYSDKAIQLEHYHSKHKVNMQKLFLSVKEGVLAEMDRIASLDEFVGMFDQSDPVFFGWRFDNDIRRTGAHQYILCVHTCLKKDFHSGLQKLMHLNSLLAQDDELKECAELLLIPGNGEQDITYESFCENYETLCNLRREKLKIRKKEQP